MKTTLIPASSFKTNVWSGGRTTELFIHPPTANFAQRTFEFRLSTATVEVKTSEFTALAGYHRKLLVLDGATKLTHENQHEIHLNKFEVDTFSGDWKTTSAGKCTDFNLMIRGHFSGKIAAQKLAKNQITEIHISKNSAWFFVYVFKGGVSFLLKNQTFIGKKGDLLAIENPLESILKIVTTEDCELVTSEISMASR